MMRLILLGTLLLSLSACTTTKQGLEKWASLNNSKREYSVKPAWVRRGTENTNLGFRKINRMTPVIVGDLLIQGNGLDGIVAYNKKNGNEKWRLNIENGVEPSAAVIRDRLFVGASDGNFYSIEASTGVIQWSFQTRSENLAAPLLDEGIIYFLAGNNVFYALDAATGRQLWLYSRQDTSQFSIRGGSQAALHNGILYVGFSDGALVALNAKTGNAAWEVQLNRNKRFRDVDATPVVDGNQIFVAAYDDKLYCISADKGEILWRVDGGSYSAVTLLGDKLIYPTTNNQVVALKKSNGEKVWAYSVPEGVATEVRPYKGSLVFGESQGSLRVIDTNSGSQLGSFEPGRGILSTPQVDEENGRIYFISGEANVYAVDAGWIRKPSFKE